MILILFGALPACWYKNVLGRLDRHAFTSDIRYFSECTNFTLRQGVGNIINLKTDDGWESNFLPGIDNTL